MYLRPRSTSRRPFGPHRTTGTIAGWSTLRPLGPRSEYSPLLPAAGPCSGTRALDGTRPLLTHRHGQIDRAERPCPSTFSTRYLPIQSGAPALRSSVSGASARLSPLQARSPCIDVDRMGCGIARHRHAPLNSVSIATAFPKRRSLRIAHVLKVVLDLGVCPPSNRFELPADLFQTKRIRTGSDESGDILWSSMVRYFAEIACGFRNLSNRDRRRDGCGDSVTPGTRKRTVVE